MRSFLERKRAPRYDTRMRRFGSFHAQWFLPGRIDGILGIAILLGVCMTPIPWTLEFTPPFSVPSRLFLFVLAAACGGTLGFLNLVDLYVLFGRDSMWRRFGWAVVVSAIPLLAVALSVGLTAQRGAQRCDVADT